MNRVAGLLLVALVLLLGITLTQAQPAQAQVSCPATGEPSVECDASSQCFHQCCLTSGLCGGNSCTSSLDTPNNGGSICKNKCLDEVRCNPFNPACVPGINESCIGTISCETARCGGKAAGSICLYTVIGLNFKVCEDAQ